MTDTELLNWLDRDGKRRRWTFWMGYNHRGEVNAHTTWPVFTGTSIREAIRTAIEHERSRPYIGEGI